MLKSAIGIILLSTFTGLFAGSHLPHIRMHQAVRELCSRRCDIDTKTMRSAIQVLLNQREKPFVSEGLEALDLASDNGLEYLWFTAPNSIKMASDSQLYVISTIDKNYQFGRDYVFHEVDRRHYRKARDIARVALALRGSGKFHNTWREAYFASFLISLQLYPEAEKILKNLLPVEFTIKERECPTSYREYRKELLGQALLGQRKFLEAAEVLTQSPDETSNDSLAYLHAIALLGMHRDKEALQSFKSIKWTWKNPFEDLFIELCSPAAVDESRKNKVMKLAIKFRNSAIGGIDDLPTLELAVIALNAKGFDNAAAELTSDIHVLRQN